MDGRVGQERAARDRADCAACPGRGIPSGHQPEGIPMTIEHLKSGKPDADRAEDDAAVRASVDTILADIAARGDDPAAFRLTPSEIEAAMSKVSARDMDDIRFAQTQIRRFAEAQRASMTDIEVETLEDRRVPDRDGQILHVQHQPTLPSKLTLSRR